MLYSRLDRFYRKINRMLNVILDRCDLSSSQLLLLNVVAEKKIVNAKEIRENMDLDSASVAGLIARLQKKKALRKTRSVKDHRFFELSLTTRGKELQSSGSSLLEEFDSKIESLLSIEEGDFFRSILDKMESLKLRKKS